MRKASRQQKDLLPTRIKIPSVLRIQHQDIRRFFKVRMNAKARSVLGADGKLPVGSVFPEGSIVVKDLYNTVGGARQLVAIMRKESANPYAKEGWLWAEMQADGGAYVSAKDKGVLCTGCHSSNDRDFVRTFDLF